MHKLYISSSSCTATAISFILKRLLPNIGTSFLFHFQAFELNTNSRVRVYKQKHKLKNKILNWTFNYEALCEQKRKSNISIKWLFWILKWYTHTEKEKQTEKISLEEEFRQSFEKS